MVPEQTSNSPIAYAFDRKIVLADGSEWPGTIGEEPETPSLWIWLDGEHDMSKVFQAFSDPEKTRIIKSVVDAKLHHDTYEETYENYTRLTDLKVTGEQIKVQLRKGRDSE